MIGQQAAHEISARILDLCQGEQVEVVLQIQDSSLTRFANNSIHQNVSEANAVVSIRMALGKQVGAASTNDLSQPALAAAVAAARVNAQTSPADPDFPGLAEPAVYSEVNVFDEPTAYATPQQRAQAVATTCRLAAEKGLNASGAFTTGYGELAVANSNGVFAYHAASHAEFLTTVMGEDSSGRAQASGWQVGSIPVEALSREAIGKAERGRSPRLVEPGEYPVVLDPYATHDILNNLNFHGMGAQEVQEGRSWMNERIGQPVMSPLVSIWDDGLDPRGEPAPFDYEGVPKHRVDIVSAGVVGSPVYDRYTAHREQRQSTGHALPPRWRGNGPVAANLFFTSGIESTEAMIRSTGRGLYITRFFYTRLVHPRDCIITGMTRDGVFWIEGGELAYPVKNLRFTQSYVQALAEVESIGAETRLISSEYSGFSSHVPALKIARFTFTGVTV